MIFTEKIQQIEEMLGNSKKFKNKNLLACAIYYRIRTNTAFRKIPLSGIPFSWYNLRYWLQKLQNEGKLTLIQNIVGGGES